MAPRPLAAATATAAALVLLAGCTGGGGEEPEPEPGAASSATTSTLADVDVASLPVHRGEFCGLVAKGAPQAALDGEVEETVEYGVGEEAEVVPGTTDVSGEYSCTFTAADGTAARAWVFAPPVTPDRARRLTRAARDRDCRERDGSYGRPSVSLVCRSGKRLQVSHRGLFGDAWLACSLAAPAAGADRADLVARADAWCLSVAEAAAS
jgi:hypothetical protein